MSRRRLVCALLVVAALVATPAAGAKDFKPGDLRLCNAKRCVPVVQQQALDELSGLYYGSSRLRTAVAPRLGAPIFELRFRNGYATGIAGPARLDRFLSYGVNLDRLRRGVWYRVPKRAAAELQRLAAGLKPLHLTKAALAKAR